MFAAGLLTSGFMTCMEYALVHLATACVTVPHKIAVYARVGGLEAVTVFLKVQSFCCIVFDTTNHSNCPAGTI